MTITLKTKHEDLIKAAHILDSGGVVAFPTETVYGIGADATNSQAVKKVFAAKKRPQDNPLIVTVSDKKMLSRFANINQKAEKLIKNFWPGPLTLVLTLKNKKTLPSNVTAGLSTAAFRNPINKNTREMIALLNKPIVGPSANLSTKPSPTTALHVLHDLNGRIDAVVDNGQTQIGVESTIIDLSVKKPTILRPGKITSQQISSILKEKIVDPSSISISKSATPKAPGMKYRHYAPSKNVTIFSSTSFPQLKEKLKKTDSVVAFNKFIKTLDPTFYTWSLGNNAESATKELFSALRYLDDQKKVKSIFVQSLPEKGIGEAYMNRLKKASGNKYFPSKRRQN